MTTRTTAPPTADERYRILYELGIAFAARLEPDHLFPLVIEKCRATFDAEGASVLLRDEETHELYFPWVVSADPEVARRLRALRMADDAGIAGDVLRARRGICVEDTARDPRFSGEVDRQTGSTTTSLLCAPLAVEERILGVVQVVNRRRGRFEHDDLQLLEMLAASIAVAIDNATAYAKTRAAEERLRTQVGTLRRDLARADRFTDLVTAADAMQPVLRLMESAAASPITVLIQGETGTGKELVARGIHRGGARADGPFLAVNCAALSESLLESELFGHRRGAFTGAIQDRRGVFEAAHGGTIFLDEVGEMPPTMQAKLLRVLQEGEVTPVGDTRPRPIDVRVIAATNRSLEAEVAAGRFRSDLFYRLTAFPITLPPLRERASDVPLLVERFSKAAMGRHHKRVRGIAPEATALLERFAWPGNVRELENEIERAVALCPAGQTIGVEHLSAKVTSGLGAVAAALPAGPSGVPLPLRLARQQFERRYLRSALDAQGGNVTKAAVVLGISRVMLQKKMRTLALRDRVAT
jgi:Nif-specific regulatory protein